MEVIDLLIQRPKESNFTVSSDPIRSLLAGSVITIEVATDPQTGKLGIKFNDTFYPVESLKDSKIGSLIKVIVQSNLDQIVLKMLDNGSIQSNQSSSDSGNRNPQNSITKEDKKILREALSNFELPIKNILHQTTGVKEIIRDELKNNLINRNLDRQVLTQKIEKEIIQSPQQLLKSNDEILTDSSKKNLLIPKATLIKKNVTDFQNTELSQTYPHSSKSVPSTLNAAEIINTQTVKVAVGSDLTTEQQEVLKGILSTVTKQLIAQLFPILQNSSREQSKVFELIKGLIDQQMSRIVGDQKNPSSDESTVLNRLSLKDLPLESEKTKSLNKIKSFGLSEHVALFSNQDEISSLKISDTLQRMVSQLVVATDTLQRIHTLQPQKKEGTYFLFPVLYGNTMQFSQSYLLDDDTAPRKQNKKRPQLIKIKLVLPFIGEVVVEALMSELHVELSLYLESEQAKQNFNLVKESIFQGFSESGLNAKLTNIFVARKKSIVPEWIAKELGVQQLA